MLRRILLGIVLACSLAGSMSCGGEAAGTPSFLAFVLINPGQIGQVNLLTGGPVGGPTALSASIRNLAVRPTDGQLFGIGTDLKLYSINILTGNCTAVSNVALAIDDSNGGMTFLPNSGTIRFISVNGSNYRISSTSGAVTNTDTTANVAVIGLAVRNTDGTFFAYTTSDNLTSTTDANAGFFGLVGSSGVNSSGLAGLAIANSIGQAFFVANEGLFSVSLSTGAITLMDPTPYMDIAVAIVP